MCKEYLNGFPVVTGEASNDSMRSSNPMFFTARAGMEIAAVPAHTAESGTLSSHFRAS